MWLELKKLWLQEELPRYFEECLLVRPLIKFTQLMIDCIEIGLPRLQYVAVGRHVHQGSSTQGAVKPKVHHLHNA